MEIRTPIKHLDQTDILCDRCGQSATKKQDQFDTGPDYSTFKGSWGYGSKKDGTTQEAHFCEECSDFVVILLKKNGVMVRVTENIWSGTNILSWLTEERVGRETECKARQRYAQLLHAEIVKYSKRYPLEYLAKALQLTPKKLKKFFNQPDISYLWDWLQEYADALGVDQQVVARAISKEFKKELKNSENKA